MELKVLSDDNDLLELQVVGRSVEGDVALDDDPMLGLLGDRGYARPALLSLAETEYINSSGLALLLVWHKRFRDAGSKLVLHSVPVFVMETLKILRMDLVLNLAEDAPTALKLVRGDPA
jgi:ABC-type transporter Mla MlaB component